MGILELASRASRTHHRHGWCLSGPQEGAVNSANLEAEESHKALNFNGYYRVLSAIHSLIFNNLRLVARGDVQQDDFVPYKPVKVAFELLKKAMTLPQFWYYPNFGAPPLQKQMLSLWR